jgi:hypothetical protein
MGGTYGSAGRRQPQSLSPLRPLLSAHTALELITAPAHQEAPATFAGLLDQFLVDLG